MVKWRLFMVDKRLIAEIKNSVNIVKLLEIVSLTKAGRNFLGLRPAFMVKRLASFNVVEDNGLPLFSDVVALEMFLKFIEDYRGVAFMDAVRS